MLRVVSTNNIDVFRHLGGRAFQSMPLEHSIGADFDTTLELVRTKRPHIAIVDADVAGGDGFSLCRAVKDDPALANVRVMLVLGSVVSRSELQRVDACGCDDVLALPMHADDFHAHLAQVAHVPYRRHERLVVEQFEAQFPDGTGADIVSVENVSLGGLGVTARGTLTVGQPVDVHLRRGPRSYPLIDATVAWCVTADDGETLRAGVSFHHVPVETQLFIDEVCLFKAVAGDDGRVTVGLHGDFHETTDFSLLERRLEGVDVIDFDLREVRYLSACGARHWCAFLTGLGERTYTFRHASMEFVMQCTMLPACTGVGRVESFEAPYRCAACDREDTRLLDARAVVRDGDELIPPTLHCGACRGELVFDDIPSRYLSFLGSHM